MFLQGRPLLATAADARFFVDRDEQLKQLERSVRSGFNTVIYGDKGSGKSTLLHHIEYRERQSRPVAYVNAAGSDGVRDLIESVRQAIVMHTPGTPALTATDLSPGPVMISFDRLPPGVASAVLATELRRIGELTPTVVLVDASTAADTSYELFGRMRDQLWEMDHRWIVAVDTTDRPTLARPPADAFFDISIQLPVLGTGQVAELLRLRGSGLSESELVQIAGASEGNPRRALELARQSVVREQSVSQVLEARAARERAASELGRPHSMLLADLENASTGLSPSDEQLLASFGWTRERAGQVFRDLEKAHLVISVEERQARGRPRKLYYPNPDFEP